MFGDGWYLFGIGQSEYDAAMDNYAEKMIWTDEFKADIDKAVKANVLGADVIAATIEDGSFSDFDEAYETYSASLEEYFTENNIDYKFTEIYDAAMNDEEEEEEASDSEPEKAEEGSVANEKADGESSATEEKTAAVVKTTATADNADSAKEDSAQPAADSEKATEATGAAEEKLEKPANENYGIWIKGIPALLEPAFENAPSWLHGLVFDGIIGGVGAVLGFVPQMLLLFLFLALLEGCGGCQGCKSCEGCNTDKKA